VRALVPVALCLPELLAAQVVHDAQLSMFHPWVRPDRDQADTDTGGFAP
jgi:hypothetical protein